MKIKVTEGEMNLEDDAVATFDDKNSIIESVTTGATQFQFLCDASTSWPDGETNAQFLARCERWNMTTQLTATIVDGGQTSAADAWEGVPEFSGGAESVMEQAEQYARQNATETDRVTVRVFDGDTCLAVSTIEIE